MTAPLRRLAIVLAVLVTALTVVAAAGFLIVRNGPLGGILSMFADGRRAESFRTLHERLPSHAIAAGADVWSFEIDERALPERYPFDGDERPLADFLAASATTGLLVARDGTILHEAYFQGYDERSLATSFSVAKSFVGALVGIAVERGHLRTLDDPIDAYVPELAAGGYAGVTIRQLLTMSSGVAWNEDYAALGSDVMQLPLRIFGLRQGVVDVLRRLPRAHAPGSERHYASADALALGLVITRATGMTATAFLEETIWRPAGMASAAAWTTDLRGQELTHAFLGATLRDVARFGRLYLNEGRRDETQVVPADWVAASLRAAGDARVTDTGPAAPSSFGAGLDYGYLWWLPRDGEGDFLAMGIWGQFLYVHPGHRIVIVKTSTDPGFAARERETLAVLRTMARALGDDGAAGP